MSHEIKNAELGKDASVFVVGQPAWHGLGTVLDNPATAEEALRYAHLGWDVVQYPVYAGIPEKRADGSDALRYDEVPDRRANYIEQDGTFLGVVSDRYRILQNTEAFTFFDALIEEGAAIYHSAGALRDGKTIWLLAKLPETICVNDADCLEQYVSLTNSHDGSGAVIAFFTPVRIVCNNTLQLALQGTKNRTSIRHTGDIKSRFQEAHRILGLGKDYMATVTEMFRQLMEVRMTPKKNEEFVKILLPDALIKDAKIVAKAQEKLLTDRKQIMEAIYSSPGWDLPGAKGTAWGTLNGVTYWIDHIKSRDFAPETRYNYIMNTGTGEATRNRAFDILRSI